MDECMGGVCKLDSPGRESSYNNLPAAAAHARKKVTARGSELSIVGPVKEETMPCIPTSARWGDGSAPYSALP